MILIAEILVEKKKKKACVFVENLPESVRPTVYSAQSMT